jgi:ankyrin repeat protein
VNIQNGEHRTPLHLAASLGDIEMCKLLIECGARINSFIQTSSVSYYFLIIKCRLSGI